MRFAVLMACGPLFAGEVQSNGAYSHTVEIQLPPGTNGMQPKLALSYNSNSGNGMVGVGWSLSGIPQITRGNRFEGGINYQESDYLSGDGQDGYYFMGNKMIPVGDGTGNFNAVFHTQIEDFSKYEPSGLCGDGPCFWKMTDHNGTQFFFGESDDARLIGNFPLNAAGSVRVWALNKVVDLHGNFYEVRYLQDNGEIYPAKIIYTQNAAGGISRFRVVEFEYDESSRTDYPISFASSSPVRTKWRLSDIVVKTNVVTFLGITIPFTGDLVRRYHLAYESGAATGRSRLISIQEFGSDDSSALPPNLFQWYESPPNLTQTFTTAPENIGWSKNYGNTIVNDFNGDGKSDIVLLGDSEKYTTLHLSVGGSFSATNIAMDTFTNGRQLFDFSGGISLITTALGDIDGDGRPDIVSSLAGNNTTTSIADQYVFSPDTTDNIGTRLIVLPQNNSSLYDATDRNVHAADFDGDGRSDILLQANTTAKTSYILQSTGNGANLSFQRVELSIAISGTDTLLIADFNANGRGDILQCTKREDLGYSTVKLHLSSYDGTLAPIGAPVRFKTVDLPLTLPLDCRATLGDFNGDGKLDLISAAGGYKLYLGNGFTFADAITIDTQALAFSGVHTAAESTLLAGDFNGDGRDDLFVYSTSSLPGAHITYSNGENFTPANTTSGFTWQSTDAKWRTAISDISLADINGDGLTDVVVNEKRPPGAAPPPTRELNVLVSNTTLNDKLQTLTSPTGMTVHIEYTAAAAMPDAIKPLQPNCVTQYGVSFCDPAKPYGVGTSSQPNPIRGQLVSKLTVGDGRGAAYATTYEYHNARLLNGDYTKRRDLGFEWQRITKPSGQYTIVHFNQVDSDLTGKPLLVQEFDSTGGLASETSESYTKIYPYLGTVFPVVTQKQVRAYEDGILVHNSNVTTALDSYGFPAQRTTSIAGFIPVVEIFSVIHDIPNNIFGRVTNLEIHEGTVTSPKLKHERNIYNGSGATCGQPTQLTLICEKQVWLDRTNDGFADRFIATKYTYTIYGLIATITDPLNRVTQYVYETDYQTFPAQITDPKGFRMAHVYDAKYGVQLSDTDLEDGVTISREYDAFGRTKKIRDANGTVVKEYIFVNEGNPNSQYIEVRTADGSSEGYYWFREFTDGMGRLYHKESEGFNVVVSGNSATTVIANDTSYDGAGRIATESNEYLLPGGTPRIANFTYDARGRLLSITYPDDRNDGNGKVSTSYGYSTATIAGQLVAAVSATEATGNTKIVYKNAAGKIVRISDPMGAMINNTYDFGGRLSTTMDAEGNVTSFEYDSLGRKLRMVEPNMGTTLYKYDDVGNLIEHIDAKMQVVQYTYDELNRITLKNFPGTEADVTYEYDLAVSTFGKRRLSKVTDGAGTVEYNYDNRGNMSTWKRTVINSPFRQRMTSKTVYSK